jgi:AraC-like DNA-binding protein/mannose-6-phosphate isomerase-like protein (cupin superfamily)
MSKPPAPLLPFPARVQPGTKIALIKAIRTQVEALKSGNIRWHVPRLHHVYESRPAMPYHFKPEIFLQLSGVTDFTFPDEQVTLEPGSVCIVPRGMPHGERARADQAAFENIVISFYNGTIYIHFAHERSRGRPAVDSVNFFTTELFDDLILYLDRIAELHHADAARHEVAIRALLLAEFSLLLGVIEMPSQPLPPATDTIALCKWLVHQRLQDEHLNLDMLAAELGLSTSYLSRLFHRKVGERIVEHINRLRIQNAADTLRNTRVSVKVIAAGCGYGDAGYFGRLFRQATGYSPQEYRRNSQQTPSSLEMQPKTVYAQKNDQGAVPDLGEMNALDALRLTKLSVKAIAAGCGYRDVNLFSQFFRQATGTSPQKYRRDIQRLTGSAPVAKDPAPGEATARVAANKPKKRSSA